MPDTKSQPARARHVSMIYIIITAIWIVLSDRLLNLLTPETEQRVLLQTIKGLLFILLTAALIYVLLRRELRMQEQTLNALRNSEAKWRSLVANAPDIIFTVNRNGEILFINHAPDGLSLQEALGTSTLDYVPQEYHATVRQRIESVFETGEPTSYELEARGPHGAPAWYLTRLAPIKEDDRVRAVILITRDISERKQTEEALQVSEARYRDMFNNSPVGIFQSTPEGRYRLVNPAFAHMLGHDSPDQVMRDVQKISDLYVDPAERERITRLFEAHGELVEHQIHYVHTSGQKRWMAASAQCVYDDAGNISYYDGFAIDITARKQAQQELQASEEKYRQIVEAAHVGILVVDTNNSIIFANARLAEMLGYAVDELLGQSLLALLDADNQRIVEAQIERRKQGLSGRYEVSFQRQDGTLLWAFISSNPLLDQYGQHQGSQAMISDITELKHAQEAEREHRVVAEALAETARALISALHLDDVMHTILENIAPVVPNDAANIMLIEGDYACTKYWRGYEPEYDTVFQQYRLPLDQTFLDQMQTTGSSVVVSYTEQHPSWVGSIEWVKSFVSTPIRSHGTLIGFLNVDSRTPGFFTERHAQYLQLFADQASLAIEHAQLYEQVQQYADNLEQRVAERTAELNHVKERTEAILNSSNDVIILCRKNGTIDQVNRAFYTTFGQELDEVLNQPLSMLVIPEHTSVLDEAFETVVRTQKFQRVEVVVRAQKGDQFDADIMLSPVVGPENELLGIVGGLRDITQHKQLEARLHEMLEHEMELNELKSRYVGMAAHDLRNPLAVIKSAVDIIQRYRERLTEERLQSKLDVIQVHIQTMVAMLDDILVIEKTAAGKLTFEPAPIDLVDFCRRIGKEVEVGTEAPERIVVTCQESCESAVVDEKLLRHILGNLLSNALKYSLDESKVTFTIDCQPDQIDIRVQDQGIGIPEADQARLFLAFHRASNAKHIPGTGLGLSIVKQAVELHGGTITFESAEGEGTTFVVTLPIIEDETSE